MPEQIKKAQTPMVLLPYQQRWIADVSQVKVIEKSRRIGLSWCEAADDVLLAATESGMDVWYIGYNKDMALEFIEDCADWCRIYNMAAAEVEEVVLKDEDRDILSFRIRFASGHKITALSSRPSNLRGKQGKVVIDEAAFHDDFPGLLKAAIALLMWGGRVVIISTHNGEDNAYNEVISDIRAGRKPYSLHRVTLDDALNEGLYKRICLRLGKTWTQKAQDSWRQELIDFYGEDADEELFCIPSQGTGTYLTRAMIESCMNADIPIFRWSPPAPDFVDWPDEMRHREMADWCKAELDPVLSKLPNRLSWFGEDFGRDVDLTVIWPVQDSPGLRLSTPFMIELSNCPFTQQEQVLFYMADRLPMFSGGALDKRGNGAFLAERARQRYGKEIIEEVAASNTWYIENMPPFKAYIEDKTISLPRDREILDDLRAIKKIKGVPKIPDVRTERAGGGKRHGDAAIAGCLAVFAARTIEAHREFAIESTMPMQSAGMFRGY